MRVALINSRLPHYRGNLYRLLDMDATVDVVHYADPSVRNGIKAIDTAELKSFRPVENRFFGPLLWQSGAIKAAMDSSFDCYIFVGDVKYISTWLAGIIARIRRKKVHFWTIGWHRPEVGIKRIIRLAFYQIANRLMVYGDPEKEMAASHGYASDRIDVVYNSVAEVDDIDYLAIASERKSFSVGAIARLNTFKNFDLLLEAAAVLKSRGEGVKIVLGGDGPARRSLEELACRLGLDCDFLGSIHDSDEIEQFYRSIRVTVMPSLAGLTTIQSLAHGVPVVTDDNVNGQAPEASAIIPGSTGSRYETGNSIALADEIMKWVEATEHDAIQIAEACASEVRRRWSPRVQAMRIMDSIGVAGASSRLAGMESSRG